MEYLVHGTIQDNTKEVLIFLHGFPGISTKQNQDLAQLYFEKTMIPTIILFYPGLSIHPGTFAYTKTYHFVKSYIQQLISKYPNIKINLFGHSFGGYLSLRLAKDFNHHIHKIFLLSPLLHVISDDFIRNYVTYVYENNPQLDRQNIDDLIRDHHVFIQNYDPQDLKKYLENKSVFLLQAQKDHLTPTENALDFVQKSSIQYKESSQEHSFLADRNEVLQEIIHFFDSP